MNLPRIIFSIFLLTIGVYVVTFWFIGQQKPTFKDINTIYTHINTAERYLKHFPKQSKEIYYLFRKIALKKFKTSKKRLDLYLAATISYIGAGFAILALPFVPPFIFFLIFGIILIFGTLTFISKIKEKTKYKKTYSFLTKKIAEKYIPSYVKKIKNTNLYSAILDILCILVEKDTPASIYHHAPHKGGLREHSLRVARKAVEIYKNRYPETFKEDEASLIFLMGLAHDIGKIRTFFYEKGKKESLPSPVSYESKNPFISGWKSTGLPVTPHSKMIVNEILLRNNFDEKERESLLWALFDYTPKETREKKELSHPKLLEFSEIVRHADHLAVSDEIEEVKNEEILFNAFIEAIKQMNINQIYARENDGWYDPEKNLLFLILWKLCNIMAEIITERNPTAASILGAYVKRWVETPPIWYKLRKILRKKGFIPDYIVHRENSEEKYIPTQDGIVDIKVKDIWFKSVVIIKADNLPYELKSKWSNKEWATIYPIRLSHPYEKLTKEICKKLNIPYHYSYTNLLSGLLGNITSGNEPQKVENLITQVCEKVNNLNLSDNSEKIKAVKNELEKNIKKK